MIKQIVLADNPILRRKLKPVKKFDRDILTLTQDLIDTMIFANGAGLAANQIGVDAQVFVTGISTKPQVFINPKLKSLGSKDSETEEGCLSLPGYRGNVRRSQEVEITFDDIKGKRRKKTVKGYLARVLQHEIDHLQGKTYIDRITDKSQIHEVTPIRIAFFGSGEFAVPVLVSLIGLNWTFDFQTVISVTQPPKPTGRKGTLTKTAVHQVAERFNLPLLTPEKLDDKFIEELQKENIDMIILADYGKILPAKLLEVPEYGGLCLHPSRLPKYRGATPIEHTILNGDEKTGVTLFKMNKDIDAGEIIGQYETEIRPNETYELLRGRLAQLAALMVRNLLPYYTSKEIEPELQSKEDASNAPKFNPEAGQIKPTDSQEQIIRKVHALAHEPGVYTIWKGKRIKILAAHLENGEAILDVLQPEGSKPMSWKEFHNGYPDFSLSSPLSNATSKQKKS
jgi:methionyl-tRNA formyltransferase